MILLEGKYFSYHLYLLFLGTQVHQNGQTGGHGSASEDLLGVFY